MRLYRVTQRHGSNQGGYYQWHSTTVLYCGYDRAEAVRVYHLHAPTDTDRGPGSPARETRCQSKEVTCNVR